VRSIDVDSISPLGPLANGDAASELQLMQATIRINTLIFSLMLGVGLGTALLVLSLVAASTRQGGLAVFLIGVFLPGYARGWEGALIGFLWGFVLGALLGAIIYRINGRHVLEKIDELVIPDRGASDFPSVVLRLHGPSLGRAIGAVGALGLVTTTNILVIRGTAAESAHARLLAEVLPGYTVSFWGSIVGAIELFAVLYAFFLAFAYIYNRLAERRQPR
jgi:hypothetical protein